jgi:predicted nucleic acid-binding protein
MSVFVDTSALLALLDGDDVHHDEARETWERLADADVLLTTTNYVLLETAAVVQHRLGVSAVRALFREIAPLMDLVFVDAIVHEAAVAALLAAGRRHLTLVDCSSFEVMRRGDITRACAFDRHFAEQGFELE